MITRNIKIRNYVEADKDTLLSYANDFLSKDISTFINSTEGVEDLKNELIENLESFFPPSKDTHKIVVEDADSSEFLGFVCFQKDEPYLVLNFVIPNPNIKIGTDGLNWLKKAIGSGFKRYGVSEMLVRFYDEQQPFIKFLKSKQKIRIVSTDNVKLIQLNSFEISKL